MKDPKDFQEQPDLDLVEEIFQLGKRTVQHYGEIELGNFIISLAWDYQSKIFERDTRKVKLFQEAIKAQMQEYITRMKESGQEHTEDELIEKIDFDKLKKH